MGRGAAKFSSVSGVLHLVAACYAVVVQAQDVLPNDTCVTATRLETPFFGNEETNQGARATGPQSPAFSCPRFDSESAQIVFYKLIGDGSCSCVELRGNNAFIVGVYSTSQAAIPWNALLTRILRPNQSSGVL